MDTLRPLDGSGPTAAGVKQDAGSAPVARTEAAGLGAQRDLANQAPTTVSQSVVANQEVLATAESEAVALDGFAVEQLAKEVLEGRYLLDPRALVDRLMEDAGQLLPVSLTEE